MCMMVIVGLLMMWCFVIGSVCEWVYMLCWYC